MVRKIISLSLVLVLIVAISTTAQAYDIYDGTPSNTYITYFRDIIAGADFSDNYVAFRSGQNEYIMLVGDIELSGTTFTVNGSAVEYKLYADGTQYNSNYRYSFRDVDSGSVNSSNNLVYSDLGNYPELMERGAKYEILTTYLVIAVLCCIVVNRVFFNRLRR